MSDVGTIVDLFCGCGGFSLGAELAGFRSLAAVDVEPTLQSAYRRNFPSTRAIQASVADIDLGSWRRILGPQRPDGVIGGPPCQGFSWIGKKAPDDPRNTLLHQFYRHVALLEPRFFVMENVEGLLHESKVGFLRDAIATLPPRYEVHEPIVINAADLGAATARQRVVVMGWDRDRMDPLQGAELLVRTPTRTTVRDAIADLPSPCAESKNKEDFGWASYSDMPPTRLSSYARMMRTPPRAGLGDPNALHMLSQGMVSGLTRTVHSAEISRRYATIMGGRCDPITKSHKLQWDGLCPTLRAGTGAEKGSFQAVRPLHPARGRVITVREAARLQGFPDWFLFHPAKWHSFRMIGNSVSPIVSRAIFDHIRMRMQLPLAA